MLKSLFCLLNFFIEKVMNSGYQPPARSHKLWLSTSSQKSWTLAINLQPEAGIWRAEMRVLCSGACWPLEPTPAHQWYKSQQSLLVLQAWRTFSKQTWCDPIAFYCRSDLTNEMAAAVFFYIYFQQLLSWQNKARHTAAFPSDAEFMSTCSSWANLLLYAQHKLYELEGLLHFLTIQFLTPLVSWWDVVVSDFY